MKFKIAAFLLCLLPGIMGCVKENRDDCPEDENVTRLVLMFEYLDLDGKDVFENRIDMIDVAIFDDSYNLQYMDTYRQADLTERCAVYDDFTPGTYYIVCWGNVVSSRDELPVPTYNSEIYIDEVLLNHKKDDGVDQLHYAPDYRNEVRTRSAVPAVNHIIRDDADRPQTRSGDKYDIYRVDVPAGVTTYKTEAFMCAYRTINVYVSGIDHPDFGIDLNDPLSYPLAGVDNLPQSYSYYLEPGSEGKNIDNRTTLVEINHDGQTGKYARATFYVPHFEERNDIIVYATEGNEHSALRRNIRLEKFLSDNNIDVFDGDELVINILFRYLNGVFAEVVNPGWNDRDIKPIW